MEIMDAVIGALARGAHHGDPRQPREPRGLVLQRDRRQRALVQRRVSRGEAGWRTGRRSRAAINNQTWVVGADLRNELRNGAAWGGTDPKLDWHAAAERGGKAVLAANPRLLIMVESPEYSTNFIGFDKLPVKLPVEKRLVYSPHAYYDEKYPFSTYEELKQAYDARVGFLLHVEPGVPLWVGEFGTCQDLNCGANADWFRLFMQLLQDNELLSWSYWPSERDAVERSDAQVRCGRDVRTALDGLHPCRSAEGRGPVADGGGPGAKIAIASRCTRD